MSVAAAVLALVLLRLRAVPPRISLLLGAAAILLCTWAGLMLPDIDQPLDLGHRSGLTHSILPALAATIVRWARPVAAGLALGIGLHLAADFFPNAMIGYATVKLPFAGSLSGELSYAWLGVNALACTWLGGRLLGSEVGDRLVRTLVLGAILLLGLSYLLATDGGWPALALYVAAGCIAVNFRSLEGRLRGLRRRPGQAA